MSEGEQPSYPICEKCGGATRLVTRVAPVGTWAGARIFECTLCLHHTWQDWVRGNTRPQDIQQPPPSSQDGQQPLQLQQQQEQPEGDGEKKDNGGA